MEKKSVQQRIKKSASERRRWFGEHLEKAGFEIDAAIAELIINRTSLTIGIISGIYFLVNGIISSASIFKIIAASLISLGAGFFISIILLNVAFRSFVDIKKFQRKLAIEDVLADFFQLVSANIRAGMPIDRALWFAVRPRFGVLAKEIEEVAKKVLAGGDLENALTEFAKKYDSDIVLRSVNLLNEGVKAGGNVGELLEKISTNLQEMKTLKKEMAANVTTYVIFITFAAIVAAPLLFGLSGQMLNVVQGISSTVDTSSTDISEPQDSEMAGVSSVGMSMSISSQSIEQGDYKLFVFTCLVLSSIFSSMIVSTIKHGNVKQGAHYIPIFMVVSIVLFFASSAFMRAVLSGVV